MKQSMQTTRRVIETTFSKKPGYPYSAPAVLVPPSPLLFIQGQVAWGDDYTTILGGDDVTEQSRRIFRNLENILTDAGGTLEDIVDMIIFIVDMDRFPEFLEVRKEFYPSGVYPPATAVGVKRLAFPEIKIEVHATAALTSLA